MDPFQVQLADAVDAALSRTSDVQAELAAIGVPELGLPERLGGFGLGLSADIVVNVQLGRGLVPLAAHRETVLALELAAAGELPDSLVGQVLKGTAHAVTIGVHTAPTLRADSANRLWGESEHLPDCEVSLAVVRAVAQGGDARWYVVQPDPATSVSRTSMLLGLPGRRLQFTGAAATPATPDGGELRRSLDAARIRQAAVLLGVADRALDTARGHVNHRMQFGRPLVELQTVAHRLAHLVGTADGWRLLLHEAAWRHDLGQDCTAHAAQVLAAATEHALQSTRQALHLHGVRGMLAHSTVATAYRIASVEGTRMGTAGQLWREAGEAHLASPGAVAGLAE
ncbi:acyl-CoA dehydrogenase family protein [Streptomyces sp. ITFR-6]|uniref:acyl-CoA dehydrogenase family protein n=1 Tax=Streptomyces sp. ITFR-6 TaxID=3075197 RepID=UPI00288A79C7|nr:acyl-CoA dehydrogenase family protein [Streptomyces sp. ITFR-6]WNI32317.1 acyl-CoA dehydrogenase family protein [Streptomyces sp. ITFR-6]